VCILVYMYICMYVCMHVCALFLVCLYVTYALFSNRNEQRHRFVYLYEFYISCDDTYALTIVTVMLLRSVYVLLQMVWGSSPIWMRWPSEAAGDGTVFVEAAGAGWRGRTTGQGWPLWRVRNHSCHSSLARKRPEAGSPGSRVRCAARAGGRAPRYRRGRRAGRRGGRGGGGRRPGA
jgi:hypothetical protein